MRILRRLLQTLFRRSRMEAELADELRFHIETRTDQLVRTGHSPAEAARQARIDFGAVEAYKESCREANGLAWFDELRGNLRYTFRTLRANPGFTLAAVLSLAIGIGINASAFVTVNALVLHPFPYPQLERVMTLWDTSAKFEGRRALVAPGNFFDWKHNSRAFEHLAAHTDWDATLTGVDEPERVKAEQVSAEFFEVFAMRPRLGRSFSETDNEPGRDAVAVISDGFWRSRLAADPDPIGKTLSLDRRTFTVIGVMPKEFNFWLGTQLWTPLALSPEEKSRRDRANLSIVGRLRPGAPIGQARAELASLSAELERRYPQTNEGHAVLIQPLREVTNQVTDRFAVILFGAATFVLLLACANVANLQLARSTARQREVGLRAALGASRFRIARELLTESVVIGILGGAAGLILANGDLRLALASIPAQVYQWVAGLRDMRLDASMIAFTFALSVAAGVACSLPAIYQLLRGHRRGLNETLKEGGRSSSSGPTRSRSRSTLVVVEVALSLVLLIGAGLMVRTFQRMTTRDVGYDTKNLLMMEVTLAPVNYPENAQKTTFYDQVTRGLNTLPGVEGAGAAGGVTGGSKFAIEGRAEPAPGEPRPYSSGVTPGYFRALRLPILAGRSIEEQDGPNSPPVVVLSQAMIRHYWPNSNPLGQRIRLGGPETPWMTVVGVSADLKDWFDGNPQAAAYVPYTQRPPGSVRLFVRTRREPYRYAAAARAQVRKVDRNQPVYNVKSMDDVMAEETSGVRSSATRMSVYAVISLLLAIVGNYAVNSFTVARRTQEIGIRMTLGARPDNILRMVLGRTTRTIAIGLGIGLALALTLTQVMSHALYNVVAVEPLTFVILTAILAGSALIAGYIPAHRAARIDPVTALRNE